MSPGPSFSVFVFWSGVLLLIPGPMVLEVSWCVPFTSVPVRLRAGALQHVVNLSDLVVAERARYRGRPAARRPLRRHCISRCRQG